MTHISVFRERERVPPRTKQVRSPPKSAVAPRLTLSAGEIEFFLLFFSFPGNARKLPQEALGQHLRGLQRGPGLSEHEEPGARSSSLRLDEKGGCPEHPVPPERTGQKDSVRLRGKASLSPQARNYPSAKVLTFFILFPVRSAALGLLRHGLRGSPRLDPAGDIADGPRAESEADFVPGQERGH